MVGFHGVDFAINESACCVWDADLYARNAEFIEGLRPEFFTYLADIHTADLAGSRRQLASMALAAAMAKVLKPFSQSFSRPYRRRTVSWVGSRSTDRGI